MASGSTDARGKSCLGGRRTETKEQTLRGSGGGGAPRTSEKATGAFRKRGGFREGLTGREGSGARQAKQHRSTAPHSTPLPPRDPVSVQPTQRDAPTGAQEERPHCHNAPLPRRPTLGDTTRLPQHYTAPSPCHPHNRASSPPNNHRSETGGQRQGLDEICRRYFRHNALGVGSLGLAALCGSGGGCTWGGGSVCDCRRQGRGGGGAVVVTALGLSHCSQLPCIGGGGGGGGGSSDAQWGRTRTWAMADRRDGAARAPKTDRFRCSFLCSAGPRSGSPEFVVAAACPRAIQRRRHRQIWGRGPGTQQSKTRAPKERTERPRVAGHSAIAPSNPVLYSLSGGITALGHAQKQGRSSPSLGTR